MTSYNDLSVHELLDICYSIVIGQSLDNRALLPVNNASYGTHTVCLKSFLQSWSRRSARESMFSEHRWVTWWIHILRSRFELGAQPSKVVDI